MAVTENIAIAVENSEGSGEAWGAIIGGALAAAAISLILLILGSGLGLSMVSPWSGGASATAIGVGTIIWLIVVQWIASAFGGYLTGRTRPRREPSDEVFFRDTTNGFLAWALATLLVAALLTSAIAAIVGTGTQVAATVASGAVQGAAQGTAQGAASGLGPGIADPTAYLVDSLYRPATAAPAAAPAAAATAPGATSADTTTPAPASNSTGEAPVGGPSAGGAGVSQSTSQPGSMADLRAETGRILVAGLSSDEFPADDASYLAEQISARTGIAPDVAKQRVDAVVQKMQAAKADAKAAADAARKAAAKLSLYMFLSLLIGAFVAAAAAALGGMHRDENTAIVGRV
jgi:hypothetical protein